MKLSFQREAGPILLDKIRCDANRDITLFECNPQFMPGGNCDFEAGVRCRNDQRVKTINAAIMMSSTGSITASINWELQNITMDEPRLFKVNCFNDWHSIAISVDNKTFTTNLGDLFPSSSYTCCLSAVYELYTAKGICTEIKTPEIIVSLIFQRFCQIITWLQILQKRWEECLGSSLS